MEVPMSLMGRAVTVGLSMILLRIDKEARQSQKVDGVNAQRPGRFQWTPAESAPTNDQAAPLKRIILHSSQ